MNTSKDIVLKKGDIVYYINPCGAKSMLCVNGYDGDTLKEFEKTGSVITKIERPTQYKTIYEAPKQILDQKEKEYLEAVIRPFRDRVLLISKHIFLSRPYEWLKIKLKDEELSIEDFDLPNFNEHTMYKGMELNKEYTIDELGLFKE